MSNINKPKPEVVVAIPKPLPSPLNFIQGVLANFVPPDEKFNPDGEYSLSYKLLSMAGGGAGGHAGDLSFHKNPISKNEAVMDLNYTKFGVSCKQKFTAEIRFKTNELDSPIKYKYESKLVDMKGKLFENSELSKFATLKNNSVEIVCKNKKRKTKSQNPFALSWLLFDAVQKLPRKKFDPLKFTLIDHFDQIKPDNRISFHGSIVIDIPKKKNLKLHVYDQLGDGIVPIIYYVDDSGRLLFVVSGIEVYIINVV